MRQLSNTLTKKTVKKNVKGKTEIPRQKRLQQEQAQKYEEAFDLMEGIIRIPLGKYPERDMKIKSVWRSEE